MLTYFFVLGLIPAPICSVISLNINHWCSPKVWNTHTVDVLLQPWRASALGLPHLRPRPRTPRLGPETRGGGDAGGGRGIHHQAGVSPVPDGGPLRGPVAGLWARRVRGRWSSHSRFCAVRPRLLGEDSQVLGRDPAPPRDARLQTRLPLLLQRTQHARLDAAHLPGPHRLAATLWQTTNTVTQRCLSFIHVSNVGQCSVGIGSGSGVLLFSTADLLLGGSLTLSSFVTECSSKLNPSPCSSFNASWLV